MSSTKKQQRIDLGEGSYGKIFSFSNSKVAYKETEPNQLTEYVITSFMTTMLQHNFDISPDFVNLAVIHKVHVDKNIATVAIMEMTRQQTAMASLEVFEIAEFDFDSVLYQCAKGLYLMQCAGVLHLDVKPSNLLVNQKKEIFIADFGMYDSIDMIQATKQKGYKRNTVQTLPFRAYELFLEPNKYPTNVTGPFTFSVVWSLGMTLLWLFVPDLQFFGYPFTNEMMWINLLFFSVEDHYLSPITDLEANEYERVLRDSTNTETRLYAERKLKDYEFAKKEAKLSLEKRAFFVYLVMRDKEDERGILDDTFISSNEKWQQKKEEAEALFPDVYEFAHLYRAKYSWTNFQKIYLPTEAKNPFLTKRQLDLLLSCLVADVEKRATFEVLLNESTIKKKFTEPDKKAWGKLWSDSFSKVTYVPPFRFLEKDFSPFYSSSSSSSSSSPFPPLAVVDSNESKVQRFVLQSSSFSSYFEEVKPVTSQSVSRELRDRLIRDFLHIWTVFPHRDDLENEIRYFFMQFVLSFRGDTHLAWILLDVWFPQRQTEAPLHNNIWHSAFLSSFKNELKKQEFIYFLNCLVEKRCVSSSVLEELLSPTAVAEWILKHYQPIVESTSLPEIQNEINKWNEAVPNVKLPFTVFLYANSAQHQNKALTFSTILAQVAISVSNNEKVLSFIDFVYPLSETLTVTNQLDIFNWFYIFDFQKWKTSLFVTDRQSIVKYHHTIKSLIRFINANTTNWWAVLRLFNKADLFKSLSTATTTTTSEKRKAEKELVVTRRQVIPLAKT
jgi:serine/threonine protein kinase